MKKWLEQLVIGWYLEWLSLKRFLAYLRQEWREAKEEYGHWIPAIYQLIATLNWIDDNQEAFWQKFDNEAEQKLLEKDWVKVA